MESGSLRVTSWTLTKRVLSFIAGQICIQTKNFNLHQRQNLEMQILANTPSCLEPTVHHTDGFCIPVSRSQKCQDWPYVGTLDKQEYALYSSDAVLQHSHIPATSMLFLAASTKRRSAARTSSVSSCL